MSRKEKIDFYLGKLMSRKLLTLTIATVALFRDKLDGDHWVILATVYIGMEAATNIVERLKRNG